MKKEQSVPEFVGIARDTELIIMVIHITSAIAQEQLMSSILLLYINIKKWYILSDAVKYAAELAEKEGRYRDAYGKWCQLITESERYGVQDINLYNYYIDHGDYCQAMMF